MTILFRDGKIFESVADQIIEILADRGLRIDEVSTVFEIVEEKITGQAILKSL